MTTTTVTPECKCLNCGKPLDRATHVGPMTPDPGDVAICMDCGHVMIFADDLTVREPTDDEMVQIAGDREVVAVQKARQESAIPARLRHRPRDVRGYVIPFAQHIRNDGTPDFTMMDHHKVAKCLRFRVCGICGEQLGKHVYFVGGDLCVANRYFYDPPMHKECAVYALQTCPHIVRVKGRYRPLHTIQPEDGVKIAVGKMVTDVKCEYFALMHTTAFEWGKAQDGMMVAKAAPWLDVEYWQHGKPVGPVPPTKDSPS